MSKYEPLDLVEAAFIERGSVGIYATMSFDGRIDVGRLSDAVIRVGSLVPETLCSIDVGHMRYIPVALPDVVSEIPEPVSVGFKWDPQTDTQVKILVGHGTDADSMIVGMTHVVVDGIGMRQYVSLLADAYNGTLPRLRNVRSISSILKGKKVGEPTEGEKVAATLGDQSFLLPHEGKDRFLRRVTIPAEVMGSVHDKARSQGVTLNDVFIAACARVVSRRLDLPVVRMPCPVNLRQFGDVGPLSVANMSGILQASFPVDREDSFSDTVGVVHRELAEMQARNRGLAGLARFSSICRWVPLRLLKSIARGSFSIPAIIFSNCGTLEVLTFGDTTVESYFINGQYRPNYQLALTVSSYRGATTFVHSLRGDEEGADAGEVVMNQIVGECESWSHP